MKRYFIIIILAFFPYLLAAQYYSIGEDPSGIRWRQINTPNFQIIYPSEFEPKAQRMALIFEKVYQFAGHSLQHQPRKISVILHTSTVRSNGFAAWAPSRVELFTTPDQEIYAQDWLDQLAIHELRHIVQIDKIGSELPKIFRLLFGQQAAAAVIGLYLPFWFLEGDAVVTETALSHAGRGRVPSFEMELRARSVEKENFSYDKAYLGSYKDHVADYYKFGYQMVAGIRSKYGTESWSDVLTHVARHPLSLNAFSEGLKIATGKNQTALYKEIFTDLKNEWRASDKKLELSHYELITKARSGYVSYRYPYPLNDSTLFAVRYALNDLTRFVKIGPKGEESVIFTPGNLFEESITCGNGKIFWIEAQPDIRWSHREYSLLRVLNTANKKIFEKKFRYKIFAPSLSPDGQFLAAVKLDSINRSSIVILSPDKGNIIKEMPVADDLFIITPSWNENNNGLFAVVLGSNGKSLAKIDPFAGTIDYLFPFAYNEIMRPVQRGNFVYYTGTNDGTDNLYAYNLTEKKNYRLTSARFGARDVQVSEGGDELFYSNYSAEGYKIVKMALKDALFTFSDPATTFNYKLADRLSQGETGIPDFSKPDTTALQSEPYSKLANLFNFHSWAPVHIDADAEEIRPGLSIMSQNKLSTAITQLGYDYSTVNKTGKWIARFDYTGFFPVLKFKVDYGHERSQYLQINNHINNAGQTVGRDTQLVNFTYKLLNLSGGLSLPLNFSHGKMYRLVQPELNAGYSQNWVDATTPLSNSTYIPLTYRLYAHNLQRLGHRDQQPAMGQVVDLTYRHSPFGNRNLGAIWSAEGILYLPGMVRHHGLRMYGGYQQKESSGNLSFSDLISYPRGYGNLHNEQLLTLKTDYVMPLFYPDWSLGKLCYFKRFSLRIFYDYAQAMVPVESRIYQLDFASTGGELTTDCNIFRLLVPAKFGIRSSYLIDRRTANYELLFSLNLNAL